ncbi:MAG: hypothetical protein NWE95_08080 [Candidatus Bathyarchaeota archaeon]|nr:hypothetical protein [Candidatus Bathyarchaeota archaeon]
MDIVKDRTGETCPFCGKGKLYPEGKAGFTEPLEKPQYGLSEAFTDYECDKCHKKQVP